MNGIITIILQTLLCAQVIWPHLVTFLPPPQLPDEINV